jgi:hypothetical protein
MKDEKLIKKMEKNDEIRKLLGETCQGHEFDMVGYWLLQMGLELSEVQSMGKTAELLNVPLETYVDIRKDILKLYSSSVPRIKKLKYSKCDNCKSSEGRIQAYDGKFCEGCYNRTHWKTKEDTGFWKWFDENMIYCADTHSMVHRLYDRFMECTSHKDAQQIAFEELSKMHAEWDMKIKNTEGK